MAYTTAGPGATINGKHTLRDYGLVIGNTDIVGAPEIKKNYVDIPGASKRLDLTEALTGKPEYGSRKLTFKFGGMDRIDGWAGRISSFFNELHGKTVQVILDNDPEYYYEGRAEVSGLERARTLGTFTMEVDAEPFKFELTGSDEDWLWDPFNFETGIIREYMDIEVSGSKTYRVPGSKIGIVPVFAVTKLSGTAYVTFAGKRYELKSGKNRFPELVIPTGGASVRFTGAFTVSIGFRGGSL